MFIPSTMHKSTKVSEDSVQNDLKDSRLDAHIIINIFQPYDFLENYKQDRQKNSKLMIFNFQLTTKKFNLLIIA